MMGTGEGRSCAAAGSKASHIRRVEPLNKYIAEQLEFRLLLSDVRQTSGTDSSNATVEMFNTAPAVFVENAGQWADPSIRYMHQGKGASIGLTDAGPVFQLSRENTVKRMGPHKSLEEAEKPAEFFSTQFSASFDGANATRPVGQNRSATQFNYFVGDPSDWRSNVGGFETITYPHLYDGVDLQMWGKLDHLKYEFHVAPGADWEQIQVRYDGVQGLSIDSAGDLHMQTNLGEVVDEAPVIYQIIDGKQVEVKGEYRLIGHSTYGFSLLGDFDPSVELVIDPNLAWSTYLGRSSVDGGYGIAVDTSANIFVTGETWGTGWASGGFDTSHNGGSDAFVATFSSSGQHLWSTYLGGGNGDWGYGIAVDPWGNVLVMGETWSSGWVSAGFDTSFNGGSDAFVVKLNPFGQHVWSTYLGGSSYDYGYGIGVDASGNVLVTGGTNSVGWVSGGFDTTYDGGTDAFVVKLGSSGSRLWSTYLGGSSYDYGDGVAVDALGNALVTGRTSSAGWVSGGFDTSYNGGSDVFVAKLDSLGQHLWSTYLGGGSDDYGNAVAVDALGNALVTGRTSSAGWVSGGFDTSHNGGSDAFVVQLGPSGQHLWSTYLGGSNDDSGNGVAVDASGNALLVGETSSSGWVSGGFDTSHNGSSDAFVVKLGPSGQHLRSSYLGGTEQERGYSIAVDVAGNMLMTGQTSSAGWVSGGFDTSYNGGSDVFVAKVIEPTASISGVIWQDSDADGVQDTGEPVISGWTIYLDLNSDSQFDAGEPSAITDGSGMYSITSLFAGTYTVREVIQSGWLQTYPATGGHDITLADGEVVAGVHFADVFLSAFEGTSGNDVFTLVVDPNQPTKVMIVVTLAGDTPSTCWYTKSLLSTLTFNGLAGGDRMEIAYAYGNPIPIGGVTFIGGANSSLADSLAVTGSASADTLTVVGNVVSYIGTITLGDVECVTVNGGNGNDTLSLTSAIPAVVFNGNASTISDTLNVNAGTYSMSTDAQVGTTQLALNVAPAGSVTFAATQHLKSLSVAGIATLAVGGDKVLVTRNLSVAGRLDLTDNNLVLDYSGASPLGAWNGIAYTGVTGLLASGRNGGTWDGNGIVSSLADPSGYTMPGIAEASQVLDFSNSTTALFSGQAVDATAVLVKYTYGGDANLGGSIDADDYGQIDFNAGIGGSLTGWFNGDFDFRSSVDADDYGLIDFIWPIQGSPL